MATKKKQKKHQQTKSKRTAVSKTTPKRKPARKKRAAEKASAKKAAEKKPAAKAKSAGRKVRGAKADRGLNKRIRLKSQAVNSVTVPAEVRDTRPGRQSGDLQGLSDIERADSESVDELLEEGNAFEAGAVAGVEEAGDADESEVHTHEVPEDDVPDEYLDKD
jgi:hypothetical protein